MVSESYATLPTLAFFAVILGLFWVSIIYLLAGWKNYIESELRALQKEIAAMREELTLIRR